LPPPFPMQAPEPLHVDGLVKAPVLESQVPPEH
jgi:hypothetical protein